MMYDSVYEAPPGGSGGGVTKIIAGQNVIGGIDPATGVGDVTINVLGPGSGGGSPTALFLTSANGVDEYILGVDATGVLTVTPA